MDTESTSNVRQMMHYILAWFLLAQYNTHSERDPVKDYNKLAVTCNDLTSLKDYLGTDDGRTCVTLENLTTLFGQSVMLLLRPLSDEANNLTPFPRLPALKPSLAAWWSRGGFQPLAKLECPALPEQDGAVVGAVSNYIVLIGLAMLSEAISLLEGRSGSIPFGDLSKMLDPGPGVAGNATANALGLVSRFMLHGTQCGSPRVPMYQATGQMFPLPVAISNDPGRDALYKEYFLFRFEVDSNAYGLSIEGGKPLDLSSKSENSIVCSPDDYRSFKSRFPEPSNFTLDTMTHTVDHVRRFHLMPAAKIEESGTGKDGGYLFTIPGEMQRATGQVSFPRFTVGTVNNDRVLPQETYRWATCISFQIQANTQSPELPLYTIVRLQGANLNILAKFYSQCIATPSSIAGIELLAVAPAGTATSYPVDDTTVFVYQQNQSNDAVPPTGSELPGQDPTKGILSFGRLLASALTNTGGYSLYVGGEAGGLSAALFDASGLATMTFVVRTASATSDPSANALWLSPTEDSNNRWIAWSDDVKKVSRPQLKLGTVGFSSILEYDPNDQRKYASTLGSLFSLVGLHSSLTIPDGQKQDFPFTVVASYLHEGKESYRQTVDLFVASGNPVLALYSDSTSAASLPYPSELTDPINDPYQFVGAMLAGKAILVDVYGNCMEDIDRSVQETIGWTDPLLSPSSWPASASAI